MKNLKTFDECMRTYNEGLGTAKTFAELKEGDFIYVVSMYSDPRKPESFDAIEINENNYWWSNKSIGWKKSINDNNANNKSSYETNDDEFVTTDFKIAEEKFIDTFDKPIGVIEVFDKTSDYYNKSCTEMHVSKFLKEYNIDKKGISKSTLFLKKAFGELKEGDKIYYWNNDEGEEGIISAYTLAEPVLHNGPYSLKFTCHPSDAFNIDSKYDTDVFCYEEDGPHKFALSTSFEVMIKQLGEILGRRFTKRNLIEK